MFDIFEQPWTLFGTAILVLFGVLTFRSIFPEKKHWWQWLLPIFMAVTAFGTDYLIQTDLEKINSVIDTGIKAIENEDCHTIEAIIAENYNDSFHDSKASLIAHCRQELLQNTVEKSKKNGQLITISRPNATATVFVMITFTKDSHISQNFLSSLQIKAELYLQKQLNNKWLITRVEVLEINRQRVSWGQIR
jgi:hypothetical protein